MEASQATGTLLCRSAETAATLATAVKEAVAFCGSAYLETDMRVHRNATPVRAIRPAYAGLVRTEVRTYVGCDHPLETTVGAETGDPGGCGFCNF